MRRVRLVGLAMAAIVVAGCGSKFELPTEHSGKSVVPSDKSYAMLQTWKNMSNVRDVLITRGSGAQLFLLKNWGGAGGPETPRGDVQRYPFANPVPINSIDIFAPPRGLFSPVALAWSQGNLFILDEGDSCMAKFDAARGTCEAYAARDDSLRFTNIIRDYSSTWRVRQYQPGRPGALGGDTISTFTDTTFARVSGIAADDAGNVYVAGWCAVLDTSANDNRTRTRMFKSRILRYSPGPRYPGVEPADIYMPGANWHRDTTWRAIDGTGISFIQDPAKMVWSTLGGGSVFVADRGNNAAKLIATYAPRIGLVKVDGSETVTGTSFHSPEGVAVDERGFLYVVDRLNRRVLRYDQFGTYTQDVNVENNSDALPLLDPIAVGVGGDSLWVYVVDAGRNQVIRYQRRP
jgi:hypothetical protein